MPKLSLQAGLIERVYWLIRLRWIAVAGVVLTVFFVDRVIGIALPASCLYRVAVFLGLYNILFFLYLGKKGKKHLIAYPALVIKTANAQISLDLFSLILLIHFSGGIENPFIFYFIFHIIIASILLSRRASFLQAAFATLLFSGMVLLEWLGLIRHYRLEGFITCSLYSNPIYIAGILFVFISTLYIAAYMAASISTRLRQREKSLRKANELLGEKDRIKSEYVLRVTHDIKEHLAAIRSCIEPVTGGITGPLNQRQIDLLNRADRRTDKLLLFVKALLEITRLKLSKQISAAPFFVADIIKATAANLEIKAKAKNIKLAVSIDAAAGRIFGVKTYVEETISNLLANSIKYTPSGGSVSVSLKDNGASVLIQIKDTGIGIPKDELARVFDEFYRASNARETERDGTGLGLSIAKQVIERHGGRIWAESEEGKGSIFSIILPKTVSAQQ